MKQKAQWLSQVRMRSNTAEDTSTPNGSPGSLSMLTSRGQGRAGALDHDAEVVGVGQLLEIDDVARLLPVEGEQLIAHGQAGPGSRRRLGDRSHRGSGHGPRLLPVGDASLFKAGGNWVLIPAAPLSGPGHDARAPAHGTDVASATASIPTLTVRMLLLRVLWIRHQGPVLDHGVPGPGCSTGSG